MRFLFRLVVLVLAAVGVKALYEKLAPRQDQLRSTADTFLDRTTTAARDVGARVSDAAQIIADNAHRNAADVRDAAAEGAGRVRAAAEDARDELAADDAAEARTPASSSSTN
jgi:hypothetical protein